MLPSTNATEADIKAPIMISIKEVLKPNQLFALTAKGLEGAKVIILNIIIARYFGPETYGKFAFVTGIATLVALIGEYRLINIIMKEIGEKPKTTGKIIGSALAVNLLFSLFGACLLLAIATYYHRDDVIFYGLIIYSTSYIFKTPRALKAYFVALGKNVYNVASELFASIICILSIAIIIINSGNIYEIVFYRVLDFLYVSIGLTICFWSLKDRPAIETNLKIAKDLTRSALPLAISGFALILFQRVDLFVIKCYLGDEQVGYYSAATNYMMLFTIPTIVLAESMAPKMFSAGTQLARHTYTKTITWVGALMSVIMLLTAWFFIPLFYGKNFSISLSCALILATVPFLIGLGSSAGQLIVKDGTQHKAVTKSFFACLLNICLNLILIPRWGINGAAISSVISFFFAYFVSHYIIKDLRDVFFEQCRAITGRPINPRQDANN